MCLIVVSLNEHPAYKLIVATNRDEFYNRRTASADYWSEHPQVLGGRDLEAGGTWMAMNRNGRISMVTNYRDPSNINRAAPSRGKLVSDYVRTDARPLSYLENVAANARLFNGFNLIVGNQNELYYFSNHGDGIAPVPPGLHGLSNHLLDTPWPKVRNALDKVGPILNTLAVNTDDLLDAMYDDKIAPDNELPDTGVGLERERELSSMFIKSAGYGSRNTTIVLVDRDDNVQFVERVYNTSDFTFTSRAFSFRIT
ncbi:MAG TPA: NRDE family protein [Cyclobacteriaceae bacterium]